MTAPPVCVDASLVVRLLVADSLSERVAAIFAGWAEEARELVAPGLLRYEVVNAAHRLVRAGRLRPETGERVVAAALALPITLVDGAELLQRAFALAQVLALPSAYDAHYLAVAEAHGCELWTADTKLAKATSELSPRIRLVE
ncbi:MAG: type II toxin-antitoxin system VapC family toxin [Acidobacteriota bacterium]